MRRRRWPGRIVLMVALAGMVMISLALIGFGSNLDLPVGYYGRFNRILARVEASPELQVLRIDLHRDVTLEDFFITVRTRHDGQVLLRFQDASTRPFSDLLQELGRVGL